MKKRRADSTLFNLPESTQRAIYRLDSEESKKLVEIKSLLEMPEAEEGFGIGTVSLSSISNFLKEWRTREWRESLHAAAATAESVKGSLSKEDRDAIDDAIFDGLRECVLDSMVSKKIDAKTIKSLVGLIQKARSQEIDERKLVLLEKKAAALDKVKEVVKDAKERGIRKETLEAIEEEIGLL